MPHAEHSGERTVPVPTLQELKAWWGERYQPGITRCTEPQRCACGSGKESRRTAEPLSRGLKEGGKGGPGQAGQALSKQNRAGKSWPAWAAERRHGMVRKREQSGW